MNTEGKTHFNFCGERHTRAQRIFIRLQGIIRRVRGAPRKKRVCYPPHSAVFLFELHNNFSLGLYRLVVVRRLSLIFGRTEEDLPVHVLARTPIDTIDDTRNV